MFSNLDDNQRRHVLASTRRLLEDHDFQTLLSAIDQEQHELDLTLRTLHDDICLRQTQGAASQLAELLAWIRSTPETMKQLQEQGGNT